MGLYQSETLAWLLPAGLGLYLVLFLGVVQFMRLVRSRDRDMRRMTAIWIAETPPPA